MFNDADVVCPPRYSYAQQVCVPGIIKGYKHPMAEVRKGVVFALVEMYLTLGPILKNSLGELSSSQHKLLDIYIKRAQDRIQNGACTALSKMCAVLSCAVLSCVASF